MSTQIVMLEIPAELYTRIMQRAERAQRSVEAEFLDVLTHAVPDPRCDSHKADRIAAPDPNSGHVVRLFNPRRQIWTSHFEWSATGDVIVGKTATGRATVVALQLNRAALVAARRAWITVGWRPPQD